MSSVTPPRDAGLAPDDGRADAWPPHPLASGHRAEPAVELALSRGAAAAIWTADGRRPIWWNEAGSALFGLPGGKPAAGLDIDAALGRAAAVWRPFMERRQFSLVGRPHVATLMFRPAVLVGADQGLIVVATAVAPPPIVRNAFPPPAFVPVDADTRPQQGAGEAGHSRRLTWRTDAAGRLLAGSGLARALGRDEASRSVHLADLLRINADTVAAAFAAGSPLSGIPVETIADRAGAALTGSLFGAPALDRERRVIGYRGFLTRPAAGIAQVAPPPVDGKADGIDPAAFTGDAVGMDFGVVDDDLLDHQPAPVATAESEMPAAASPAMPVMVPEFAGSRLLVAAPAEARAAYAAGADPQVPPAGIPVQNVALPARDPAARSSNVVALRPGAAGQQAPRDPPALSPAERDAFADIARALRAPWTGLTPTAESATPELPGPPSEPIAPRDDAVLAETAFAEASRAELADILNRLPLALLVHRDGAAIAVNKRLLRLLGHASLADFEAAGGIAELFVENGGEAGEHGRAVEVRTRAGEAVAVDARCQAIRWEGAAATLISLRRARAVMDLRAEASFQAEAATRTARIGELEAVFDAVAEGIVTLDAQGRVLALNRAAEELLGIGAGEIAGEDFSTLIAPEHHQEVAGDLRAARSGRPVPSGHAREISGRGSDGRRIPLSLCVVAGADGQSRAYALLRNLATSKAAQADLAEAKAAAERGAGEKSDFLGKVSHEIRTPLNSIAGFAEIIAEERFGPLSNPRYKEYAGDIKASATRIIGLVNDLLDLTKAESGRLDLTFANINLNAEVSAGVASLQTQAARSRVLLRQSLAQGLPAIVADAGSVRQIILNLLSNAIKFTAPGGQAIVSTARSERGDVAFRIRDTGIGMSERQVAEAMQPFKQFATTARAGGSGLGLSLTRALVAANRGALVITSRPAEGTLVEIVFPALRAVAAG